MVILFLIRILSRTIDESTL